jgi:hypothetical protein
VSNVRQPGKARCKQCGNLMRNKTAYGVKLTNDSDVCVKCEADNLITATYNRVLDN